MKAMMVVAGFTWAVLTSSAYSACRDMTGEQWTQALKPPVRRIVFFASWCKSCEAHLNAEYALDSVFVAVSDDQAAADRTLAHALGNKADGAICAFDGNGALSDRYNVKFLPFVAAI